MRPWGELPGLPARAPHHFHWQPGLISIVGAPGEPGGEAAANVARGHRLGVSPVLAYVHAGRWQDAVVRAENRAAGRALCPDCGGTGNWLDGMYQTCKGCGGKGHVS